MSDILNIRVTERELELIMDLLHEAGDRVDADGQPAIEICHDLMEQSGQAAEECSAAAAAWRTAENHTFTATEQSFIQAGIEAREQAKASSRACERRDFNLKGPDKKLSAQQQVDVWAKPNNDPADW
jgi:hypothetical protein